LPENVQKLRTVAKIFRALQKLRLLRYPFVLGRLEFVILRETMPREAETSNVERNFILEALRQNVRVDGRAFDQFRPINLTFGEDYGTATVSLGKTRCFSRSHVCSLLTHSRVLVQISAEVTKPLEDRKFDGIFTITTELSPIASPAFEVGRYWTIADADTSNFTS
jgi:exosome complex RNA-binding protein Rrp42 (RNase PH superfamily)